MRRFLRVLLILLAALAIVGLASGAFKPGNRAAGGSGGSGGAASPSTTVTEVTPKIYCVVEQGAYIGLTVEVWENGEKLAPVDELDADDPHFGISDDAIGYDVYEVTPGQSEVRFVSYTANQEKKSGEIRAGSRWTIEFDEDWTTIEHFTSPGTVSIPASSVLVFVYYSHL